MTQSFIQCVVAVGLKGQKNLNPKNSKGENMKKKKNNYLNEYRAREKERELERPKKRAHREGFIGDCADEPV